MEYRQLIIARKDLNMSVGKLSTQVAHASGSFFSKFIRENYDKDFSFVNGYFDVNIYNNWIDDSFTKTVCQARNKNHLLKAVTLAEELGLVEGEDFWLIKDNCLTELEPEEVDENGVGRTLTCIGFKPMPTEIAHKISKKYQLYR